MKDHIWTFRVAHTHRLIRSEAITETSHSKVYAVQDDTFKKEYAAKHNRNWVNVVPRKPCLYHFYGGDEVGFQETVAAKYGHWHSDKDSLAELAKQTVDVKVMRRSQCVCVCVCQLRPICPPD